MYRVDAQTRWGVAGEPFDLTQLEAELRQRWVKIGDIELLPAFQVSVFDRLPSTNQQVWQWLEAGAAEGQVAIALEQTSGRGQWGRQWQSLPGGLYLSIALRPAMTPTQGTQLTMAIAWGVAEALRQQSVPVQLKWLNDLVIDGRKLGGVLVETRLRREQIAQAVVGIGINWKNPVPDVGVQLSQVMAEQQLQTIPSLERLAAVVLQGAMAGYHGLQRAGIEVLLPHYEAILSHRGHVIPLPPSLYPGMEPRMGQVLGVTAAGQLRVRLMPSSGSGDLSGECLKDSDYSTIEEIALEPGCIQLGYRTEPFGTAWNCLG